MRKVKIEWSRKIENTIETINKSKSTFLNEREAVYMYIYASKRGGAWHVDKLPLYIGKSYKRQNNETVKDRIIEHFNDEVSKCINKKCRKKIFVKIGKIILEKDKNFTKNIVGDIECCLINKNKPLCNTPCISDYTGDEIKITNIGAYTPLLEKSHCK